MSTTSSSLQEVANSKIGLARLRPQCVAVLLLFAPIAASAQADESSESRQQRLAESVKYLASDELQGRGIRTPGIELAAQYLSQQYQEIGLRTTSFSGTPFPRCSAVAFS